MIVLDIETISSNPDDIVVRIDDQRMTYTGVIDCTNNKEIDIWENDYDKLKELLLNTDLIIGYNIFGFDMPVIAKVLGPEMNNLPMLDLMVAAKAKIGYRPKLNNLSNATLGRGKLGVGSDAAKYYLSKDFDALKRYCLEDVRLTKELYEYGLKNKKIKYFDKNGFQKETDIDWSLGYRNYGTEIVEEKVDDMLSLF